MTKEEFAQLYRLSRYPEFSALETLLEKNEKDILSNMERGDGDPALLVESYRRAREFSRMLKNCANLGKK